MKRKFFAGFLALLLALVTVVVSPVAVDATASANKQYFAGICIGYGEEGCQQITDADYTVLCEIKEANSSDSGEDVYFGYIEAETKNDAFSENILLQFGTSYALYIKEFRIGYGAEGKHLLQDDGFKILFSIKAVKLNQSQSGDTAYLGYLPTKRKDLAVCPNIFYLKNGAITPMTSSVMDDTAFNLMSLVYFAAGAVLSGTGVWLVMKRKIKNMQK